jgi:hypothetical protein
MKTGRAGICLENKGASNGARGSNPPSSASFIMETIMNVLFKPIIDEMFSGDGWEPLSDVMVEVGMDNSKESCRKAFDALPEHIQMEAIQWSLGDTCFRDSMCEWLKDNSSCISVVE